MQDINYICRFKQADTHKSYFVEVAVSIEEDTKNQSDAHIRRVVSHALDTAFAWEGFARTANKHISIRMTEQGNSYTILNKSIEDSSGGDGEVPAHIAITKIGDQYFPRRSKPFILGSKNCLSGKNL